MARAMHDSDIALIPSRFNDYHRLERAEEILNAMKAELERLYATAQTDNVQSAIGRVLDELPTWGHLQDVIPGGDE
jgi:hypothetical protein